MRSAREYQTFTGGPLPIKRLVDIWRSLPEHERLGFYHSLEETIADQLMTATVEPTQPAGDPRLSLGDRQSGQQEEAQ